MTLRVLISRLAVILLCQKGNGHGCRRVLVVAGRLLGHVVVELAEDGKSVSELQTYPVTLSGNGPTFSSLSVSRSHMNKTSSENDGRSLGFKAQHLLMTAYLRESNIHQVGLICAGKLCDFS